MFPSPQPSRLTAREGLLADTARKLSGLTGVWLGWTPDIFWQSTPAELAAVIEALAGERPAPVDLAGLMEMFPDG